jgi:hypothetical protein
MLTPFWIRKKSNIVKREIDACHSVSELKVKASISYCSTVNCANRKPMKTECNLQEVEVREGNCHSFIKMNRSDIVPTKPWHRE